MTTETQTFIELSDVKAVRIECSNCHIKTTISLEDDPSRQRLKATLSGFQCPHCKNAWFTHADGSYVEKVIRFFEGLEAIKNRETKNMTIRLEVSFTPSVSQK
jgi:Zn finger protein HypA/HybF involved in hydrogenase expression